MKNSEDVAVLIPAAGEGTRLGGHRKQFRVLGDSPVLVQTLRAFERHPAVDHIVVATPREAVEPLTVELERVGISKLRRVVAGGDTRQASVRAAVMATEQNVRVVMIHDAVRPFISRRHVSAVIDGVREAGAAALAVPLADTVRRADGIHFMESVPRENLYRMQTPQGFRRDWLEDAHEGALREGFRATDDVEIVQRAGYPVHLVTGSITNVKITTSEDWEWAVRFWPVWEQYLASVDSGTDSGEN